MSDAGLSIGRRAVRGAAVLSAATYLSIIFGIAARKALALLLTPEDVGVYQAALSFVDIVISFAAFSFSSAIINVRKNLVTEPLEHLHENVFILTVVVNGFFAVLAMLLGLLSLSKTHGAIIAAIIGVYAVQRFVSALDTFYTQILERELTYSKISRVTLIVSFVLHAASVGFALLGGGAWAIPCATIISTVFGYLLDQKYVRASGLHAFHPHPFKYFNSHTAFWLWRFGWKVLFNRLFETWLFKVDNLTVAYLFGSFYLGYYSQAFSIALMPSMAVAPIVARVSIATYAGVQHDRPTLERAFALTNFFLVRLLVPATVFVLISSRDLVRVFLSSNWGGTVAPLTALAGFVLTVPLFENAKMVLGAKLLLKEISIVRGAQLAVLIVLLFFFGRSGIVNIGLFVSIVSVLGYIFIMFVLRSHVALAIRETFLLPLIIGSAIWALFYFGIDPFVSTAIPAAKSIENSIIRVLCYGPAILLLTLGVEYLIHPAQMRSHVQLVRGKWKK